VAAAVVIFLVVVVVGRDAAVRLWLEAQRESAASTIMNEMAEGFVVPCVGSARAVPSEARFGSSSGEASRWSDSDEATGEM
jgi:hypothetical protein